MNSLGTPASPGQGGKALHPEHSWLRGRLVAVLAGARVGGPGVRGSEEEEPAPSEVRATLSVPLGAASLPAC